MGRRVICVCFYIALCLPAITLQTAFEREWSIIQSYDGRGDKSLKRKGRFWNDDLEPCIMKYCLRHQMQTLRYMKCIQRHCPSGLVTVPRDLEPEMQKFYGKDISGVTPWRLPEKSGDVNRVCAKLFCGYIKPEALRQACVYATCSTRKTNSIGASKSLKMSAKDVWKAFAGKVYRQDKGGVSSNEDKNADDGDADGAFADLKSKIKIAKLCGIVFCPGLNGLSFLTCVEERCGDRAEVNPRVGAKEQYAEVSKRAGKEADDTGLENDENGSNERTMVRKRLMNGGITWCIDSYCGRQSSRTARTACIVRTCNRMG